MADVLVVGGSVKDGRVTQLDVVLHGLPPRTLDRDAVLSWMKDGHSLIPRIQGKRAPALLLLEIDDGFYIRSSGTPEACDILPAGMG